ncbi:MAG: HDOD domain-containing protein [Rhodocyclaceae bacterium]
MSPELERRLTAAVDRMPAFPKSVQTILVMTRDSSCLPKQLVGVIEKDPVMTVRILRVINSAYYALPNKIGSVGHAVVYLGINTVKNLALACAAIGVLPRFHTDSFDSEQYLLHSLAVASLARLLSEKYARSEADSSDCYVAGLLHDFGKVVFAHTMASEFALALSVAARDGKPLHVAEVETIGVDHAFVGALLARKWQFGEALVECIRDHHAAEAAPHAMLDCLRMADAICRKQGFGAAGNPWREEELAQLPARFGNDPDVIVAGLGDLNGLLAEAQAFAQIGRGEGG